MQGNWLIGIATGLLVLGFRVYEINKQKKEVPETVLQNIAPHDRISDIIMYAALFGFLGAKIFHNLENWNEFSKDPIGALLSFSGLTFYGGLICAALAIFVYCKKNKFSFTHLADAAAPALMIAYAIGRMGCHISGDGDWGINNSAFISDSNGKTVVAAANQYTQALQQNATFYIRRFDSLSNVQQAHISIPILPHWFSAYTYPHNVLNEGVRLNNCNDNYCAFLPLPVFPTPLYECIICLFLFCILWHYRRSIHGAGRMFGLYLMLNGIERFTIEKIRVNTVYSIWGFHPTQAEIISFCFIILGSILFFKKSKQPQSTH
jgi:prolipoprotein diacylglyceryltransferase